MTKKVVYLCLIPMLLIFFSMGIIAVGKPCPSCDGTGKCSTCDGTGYVRDGTIECPACDGSGNCWVCLGSGTFGSDNSDDSSGSQSTNTPGFEISFITFSLLIVYYIRNTQQRF